MVTVWQRMRWAITYRIGLLRGNKVALATRELKAERKKLKRMLRAKGIRISRRTIRKMVEEELRKNREAGEEHHD